MGQVISLSNDTDSIVASKFKQVLVVGPSQVVERHAPPLCVMEGVFIRFVMGCDQHLADDRRRGDVTYSNSPMERGEQVWSIGICLLHDAET